MLRLILPIFFMISACKSKPEMTDRGPAQSTKATLDTTNPNVIEIISIMAYAPRRNVEIEQAILLNEGIQECLRQAPEMREANLLIGIEGHLSYTGVAERTRVECQSSALKQCLQKQVSALSFGRGRLGPFKMQIMRSQPGETRAKPLLVDLSPTKKFQ